MVQLSSTRARPTSGTAVSSTETRPASGTGISCPRGQLTPGRAIEPFIYEGHVPKLDQDQTVDCESGSQFSGLY